MVRKGTELHKVQTKIFREAYCAENYLNVMKGVISKYDSTWQKSDAVYNTLSCMIHEMGWYGDYLRFCENEEKILLQQDPA